jgi:hypothetical protein
MTRRLMTEMGRKVVHNIFLIKLQMTWWGRSSLFPHFKSPTQRVSENITVAGYAHMMTNNMVP